MNQNAYINHGCPGCGGEGFFWHAIDSYELHKCKACGFVYVKNILSVSALADLYKEGRNKNGVFSPAVISRGRRLKWFMWGRIIQFIVRLNKQTNKIRLLDFGCGEGHLLDALQRNKDFEAEGIDYDSDTVNYLRSIGLKVSQSSLENMQYPPEEFDFITAFHVMEHVHNLDDTIQEIKRILKNGGYILVEVPCISHIKARREGKKWGYLHPPTHLWFFTAKAMKYFLRRHGFIVKFASYVSPHRDHLFVLAKKGETCMDAIEKKRRE